MVQYTMQEMPDLQGTGKRKTYPKMVVRGTMTLDDIAELISAQSTFSVGDVKGVVCALAGALAHGMASGCNVKIEGIGTFSPALALRKGVEPEEVDGASRRNAASVKVGGVNFRADRTLVETTNSRAILERTHVRRARLRVALRSDRLELALAHLEKNGVLRVPDYQHLTGLGHTAAAAELREFCNEGCIASSGCGSHKVYVKKRSAE